jgi:hypothetical protein
VFQPLQSINLNLSQIDEDYVQDWAKANKDMIPFFAHSLGVGYSIWNR